MPDSPVPESDAFQPLETFAMVFQALGVLGVAGGLITMVIGFRLDRVEYSGILPGLAFLIPGLLLVGIGRLMSAVAVIGKISRETLIRAEHLIAAAKPDRENP